MHFKTFLQSFASNFEEEMNTHSSIVHTYASSLNPKSAQIAASCQRLILSGGKRIRPALLYLGCWLLMENEPKMEVLKTTQTVGSALELLHTFALIHDDIIDKADTRRGQLTIEAEYKNSMNNHDAMTAALLAGDYLHTYADLLMMNVQPITVRQQYFDLSMELICGQIDDCLGVGKDSFENLDEERIEAMLAAKSGNYSIQKPLLLGAEIAKEFVKDGVSFENKRKVLERIGLQLGIIFQHTDDILGIFGTKETGKSTDTDILEGKRTLLMTRVFAQASKSDQNWLMSIVGNIQATAAEIDLVRNFIKTSGVVQQIETECRQLITQISTALENTFPPSKPRDYLQSIGTFLLERTV